MISLKQCVACSAAICGRKTWIKSNCFLKTPRSSLVLLRSRRIENRWQATIICRYGVYFADPSSDCSFDLGPVNFWRNGAYHLLRDPVLQLENVSERPVKPISTKGARRLER